MSVANTTTNNPYDCASYPNTQEAKAAPPAYWPAELNSTDSSQRACVAFPNYYMVECCGKAGGSAGSTGAANGVIHDPKCGWEVCISGTTDAQYEECFKALDAQRGNVTNKGYSFNCASKDKPSSTKSSSSASNTAKSGAKRAVVGGAVFAAACAAVVMTI